MEGSPDGFECLNLSLSQFWFNTKAIIVIILFLIISGCIYLFILLGQLGISLWNNCLAQLLYPMHKFLHHVHHHLQYHYHNGTLYLRCRHHLQHPRFHLIKQSVLSVITEIHKTYYPVYTAQLPVN